MTYVEVTANPIDYSTISYFFVFANTQLFIFMVRIFVVLDKHLSYDTLNAIHKYVTRIYIYSYLRRCLRGLVPAKRACFLTDSNTK